MDDCQYITSNDKTLLDKIGTREPPTRSQRSMADEARLAPALTGVTERLDAHDDAYEADDDGVSLTRSEGTKQRLSSICVVRKRLRIICTYLERSLLHCFFDRRAVCARLCRELLQLVDL